MAFVKRVKILSNCQTKIINYNLIKKEEVNKIHSTIIECLTMYDLEDSDAFVIECVEISKRLKTTAGRCNWTCGDNKVFKISLAYNNYIEFGSESMIKTLRHEMAHLIEVVLHGRSGHSERFKVICVTLGGHMNSTLAGRKYADSATTDYCKSNSYSYIYHCPCGMSFGRKRKITNANTLRGRCRKCRTLVMDMRMEVMI